MNGTDSGGGGAEARAEWNDGEEPGREADLKLGRDVRFLLVAVGGGAVRVARDIARQKIRYLETVAINCDARVQDAAEFDRRICLTSLPSEDPDAGGSPSRGQSLARAALPVLDSLFEGSTFVTVLASLGGGSGTGVLPVLLEAAARRAAVLSVFLIKPFACEAERRSLAERAMGGLPLLDGLQDMANEGRAQIRVLDNEDAARTGLHQPFHRLWKEYARVVGTHIQVNYIQPTEGALRVRTLAHLVETPLNGPVPSPSNSHAPLEPLPAGIRPTLVTASPTPPVTPPREAELTFEVETMGPSLPGA